MRTRTIRYLALLAALAAIPACLPAQVWEVGDRLLQMPNSQAHAFFGWAVAIGDFDGDGDSDLVVGAPNWNSPTVNDAGRWEVFLAGPNRTLTSQGGFYIGGTDSNETGRVLAAGDFDGDGRDEIALARPHADVAGKASAGAVTLLEYEAGLWELTQTLTQNDTSVSTAEADDFFGSKLAVGNFNGDDYEDLAVGVPTEALVADANTGVVHVFYGGASGLRTDNDMGFWAGSPAAQDAFGEALAAGDFDADGFDDLAVGAPYDNGGSVEIHFGSASGIAVVSGQLITDDSLGFVSAAGDFFGIELAAGNFNQSSFLCLITSSSCYDDLAIGVPGQPITFDRAGKVLVAYGSASGIDPSSVVPISPSSVGAAPEIDDFFGNALAAGYLDRSASFATFADLAIGTPSESYVQTDDGCVHLVFGASGGVDTAQQEQSLYQMSGFEIAPAGDGDRFGDVLAIGDLDGDGWGDLVVGVPYKDVDGVLESGVVQILYGALFADGFERSSDSAW